MVGALFDPGCPGKQRQQQEKSRDLQRKIVPVLEIELGMGEEKEEVHRRDAERPEGTAAQQAGRQRHRKQQVHDRQDNAARR